MDARQRGGDRFHDFHFLLVRPGPNDEHRLVHQPREIDVRKIRLLGPSKIEKVVDRGLHPLNLTHADREVLGLIRRRIDVFTKGLEEKFQ